MRTVQEYKLRFYLNASHYVIFDGWKGSAHPHTWAICLTIQFPRNSQRRFSDFEKKLAGVLEPFQNRLLNDSEPFNSLNPTLENITEYFCDQFTKVLRKVSGELRKIEVSESISRTFILDCSMEDHGMANESSGPYFDTLADSVLDVLEESIPHPNQKGG